MQINFPKHRQLDLTANSFLMVRIWTIRLGWVKTGFHWYYCFY